MKNICIFIDGTWNTPDLEEQNDLLTKSTNVFKVYELASKSGSNQISIYRQGVGTHGVADYITGGAFGWGAFAIRNSAYIALMNHYCDGDRVFIFGYSRGAAVARMLAAHLNKSYEKPKMRLHEQRSSKALHRHRVNGPNMLHKNPIPVHFLGCWDTVASFGIPAPLLGIPFHKIDLFRDMTIASNVKKLFIY